MRFSLICPTLNVPETQEDLNRWLSLQTCSDYELIVVDTSAGEFPSAAAALNEGARTAKGEYLIFLHNDIVVEDQCFLEKMWGMLNGLRFTVAGVAGVTPGRIPCCRVIHTNIVHGAHRQRGCLFRRLASIVRCETVDECLFVIPRRIFAKRPFNEFYPSWHLYAVEYCLWGNVSDPGSVVALPLALWHRSKGASFNRTYYRALDKLVLLYREKKSIIWTTMGGWPTSPVYYRIRKWSDIVKRLVRKH